MGARKRKAAPIAAPVKESPIRAPALTDITNQEDTHFHDLDEDVKELEQEGITYCKNISTFDSPTFLKP
jgi:hypothetical protein